MGEPTDLYDFRSVLSLHEQAEEDPVEVGVPNAQVPGAATRCG